MAGQRHAVGRRLFRILAVAYFVLVVAVAAFVKYADTMAAQDTGGGASMAAVWLFLVNPFTMLLPPSMGPNGILLGSLGIALVMSIGLWLIGNLFPKPHPADTTCPGCGVVPAGPASN